jgi:hypothetical protein
MEIKENNKEEKEFLQKELDELSEKKEKHLKDFSEEEITMIKLMANIFVRNLLENKLCKK